MFPIHTYELRAPRNVHKLQLEVMHSIKAKTSVA